MRDLLHITCRKNFDRHINIRVKCIGNVNRILGIRSEFLLSSKTLVYFVKQNRIRDFWCLKI